MGKPFPERKYSGEFPPDVQRLVEKSGNVSAAERAAGVAPSTFSKIRAKSIRYTPLLQERVAVALNNNGETQMIDKEPTVPDTCPPLLANLIKHMGNKALAIKALGTSDSAFYATLKGRPMPPAWIPRAKAAMGLNAISADVVPPAPVPQIPEFVPWDGKLASVTLNPRPGQKKGRAIKLPGPLAQLIERHHNISQAAQSMGYASGSLTAVLADPKKFTDAWQRRVHAALHGIQLRGPSEDFDKYTLGLAIVQMAAGNFDRIADIAEILNGRLVFKRNTSSGWLMIYKMTNDDLRKFKRLAGRDAKEIVCP